MGQGDSNDINFKKKKGRKKKIYSQQEIEKKNLKNMLWNTFKEINSKISNKKAIPTSQRQIKENGEAYLNELLDLNIAVISTLQDEMLVNHVIKTSKKYCKFLIESK